jgi:hypothetical protein
MYTLSDSAHPSKAFCGRAAGRLLDLGLAWAKRQVRGSTEQDESLGGGE